MNKFYKLLSWTHSVNFIVLVFCIDVLDVSYNVTE